MDEIHFDHWLPYFDNSSYDIVLNVYLPPASIERITLLMISSGDEPIGGHSLPEEKQDTFRDLRWHAQNAGRKKARSDQANKNYFSPKGLSEYAESSAQDYIDSHVTSETFNGKMPNDISPIYVKAFIEGYIEYYLKVEGVKDLPSEANKEVQRKARADKERDLSRKAPLSARYIIYQAATRANEVLNIDTSKDAGYLDEIDNFVRIYQQEYEKYTHVYKKEEYIDLSDRPDFR